MDGLSLSNRDREPIVIIILALHSSTVGPMTPLCNADMLT